MPSAQANSAAATRAQANPTTRLRRLPPPGQLPSVLPHLSSGRSAGQQEDFHAINLLWESLYETNS